jgi:predicted nuclease of predicted toxin-antitoxin system
MKILLDMNLSPDWVEVLKQGGFHTVHWSEIGDIRATDGEIMNWAQTNEYVVFTHDLDFGILLAVTQAKGPSVIQIRTQDVFPQTLGERMVQILKQHEKILEKGALITVDESKSRARILPFP